MAVASVSTDQQPEEEELDLEGILTGPKYIDAPAVPGIDNVDLELRRQADKGWSPVTQSPEDQDEVLPLAAPADGLEPNIYTPPEDLGEPVGEELLEQKLRTTPNSTLLTSKGSSITPAAKLSDLHKDTRLFVEWPPEQWAEQLISAATESRSVLDGVLAADLMGLVKLLSGQLHQVGERVAVIVSPASQLHEADQLVEHLKAMEIGAVVFLLLRAGRVTLNHQLKVRGYFEYRDYEWVAEDGLTSHEKAVLRALMKRRPGRENMEALRRLR